MPTFEDPKADAHELGQAARGLAYATRHIETPEDTYEVLGSLHQALSGVQQSLQQLSAWHARHAQFAATDDGNREAGQEDAAKASAWLTIAAASTEEVLQLVMKAQSENGRIAWQPDRHIAASPSTFTALPDALGQREAALNPDSPMPSSGSTGRGGLSR